MDWHFFRTRAQAPVARSGLPGARSAVSADAPTRRSASTSRHRARCSPDVIHAHSPVLNALRRCARQALSHSAGLRSPRVLGGRRGRPRHHHRRQPALQAHAQPRNLALKRADHVYTICEGLRGTSSHAASPTIEGHGDSERCRHRELSSRAGSPTSSWCATRPRSIARCSVSSALSMPTKASTCCSKRCRRCCDDCPTCGCCWSAAAFRRAALKARRSALDIEDKVIFTGRVPHAQVAALLRPDRCARLPAAFDAPNRTGDAAEAAGGDGAGPAGCWRPTLAATRN